MALAGAVGNRAMGSILQRAPAAAEPALKAIPTTSFMPTREEVDATEAWVLYLALRARGVRPQVMPVRYQHYLENLRDAIWGEQGNKSDPKRQPATMAKSFLHDLRAVHDQVIGTKDHGVFDLADLALQRAAANAPKEGAVNAFDASGATEIDQAVILNTLRARADEELAGAKEMGYTIPEELQNLGTAAGARWDRARKSWKVAEAPNPDTLITPTDELALVKFRDAALETIVAARSKRAADLAHRARVQAEELEVAAEKHMIELATMIADRRRALFMSHKPGPLGKIRDAIGEVTGVIDEMKGAAKIVTSRVDTLNKIASMTGRESNLINLPEVPKGITGVADKLKSAHDKLNTVLDLLEIVGPAKTKMDEGLKYLKGLDLSLDLLSPKGNPFISVYVNSYLRPGIQNCIAQLGKIANIISEENRRDIGSGDPRALLNVQWSTEPGGEHAYLFLAQLFKVGGAAMIDGPGWEYFRENAEDLQASVGEAPPSEQRALGAWAFRHRGELWETFYGSTPKPRR